MLRMPQEDAKQEVVRQAEAIRVAAGADRFSQAKAARMYFSAGTAWSARQVIHFDEYWKSLVSGGAVAASCVWRGPDAGGSGSV
jgi:hypothetical protein